MLLLLLSIAATLNVAAAATLNVSAGKLTALNAPVDRCYSDVEFIPVTRNGNVVAVVGRDVDPACNGEIVTVTLRSAAGTLLATSIPDVVVGQPTFTVPFPPTPQVALTGVGSIWMTIKGFPLARVQPVPSYSIAMNDWSQAYHATLTATNATNTAVPWGLQLAMNRAPLNGTPCTDDPDWGDATTSFAAGVLTATPISTAATVGGASSTRSVTFCMERSEAPPPAEDGLIVTAFDLLQGWADGFNAEITIEAPTTFEPSPWTLQLDFSAYEHGVPGAVDSVWIPGSEAPSYSYDAPILTLSAVSTQHWISAYQAVKVRFGVSGGLTLPEPDPDEGPTFTAGASVPWGSHHGSSYNGQVTVTTDSPTAVPWTVSVDLSDYGFGVPSSVGGVWGPVDSGSGAWSYDPSTGVLTARSVASNASQHVSASTPVTFNFSAAGVTPTPRRPDLSSVSALTGNGCYAATVTSTATEPSQWHAWEVTLDLSAYSGNPASAWGATSMSSMSMGANRQLTVWGNADQWAIQPGQSRTINFCLS